MPQREFPCAKCGAKLTFEPGTQMLKCAHCGYENPVPQSQDQVAELDYNAYLERLAAQGDTHDALTVNCSACGAKTSLVPDTVAGKCPFCGSAIVAQGQSHRLIKPKAILPFGVTKEKAFADFQAWLASLWFAPSALKKMAEADEHLAGVYIPYWTYDTDTITQYAGRRGDDYTVIVGSGKDQHSETRTRWTSASGQVEENFLDVLVLASKTLPTHYTEELEPWDLAHLADYGDEYLGGFVAESYQIGLAEGFITARQKMAGRIKQAIDSDIGGDHQQIVSANTAYNDITFKHLLLPIWLATYRYQGAAYRFLVNGRTGQVRGERPYSPWKIAGAVIAGLVIVVVIALIVSHRR